MGGFGKTGATRVMSLPFALLAQVVDNNDEKAKAHFELGENHYKAGRYRAALAEFRLGHALSGKPEFYFNFGQCYWKLGQIQGAIDAFQQYLQYLENKPDADEEEKLDVQVRIKALQDELKAKKQAAVDTPRVDTSSSLPSLIPSWAKWAALGVAGIGATAGIFGTVKAGEKAGKREALKEELEANGAIRDSRWANAVAREKYGPRLNDLEESTRRYDIMKIVGFTVGGAVAVGALVFSLLDGEGDGQLTLQPAPQGGVIGFETEF